MLKKILFILILAAPFLFIASCKDQATSPDKNDNTLTDYDGNVYKTIKVGDQWWMAENLRVTHYRSGEAIPNVTDNTEWSNLTTGAYCAYDNDNDNIDTYGLLYNCYAVDDSRNIAPKGWHVPTDEDFTTLENYLIANGLNWDGTADGNKIGKALAAKTGWNGSAGTGDVGNDMPGNNTSGFSALPAGYRSGGNGTFVGLGSFARWWSSTEYDAESSGIRGLNYNSQGTGRNYHDKHFGFSLRLVKD